MKVRTVSILALSEFLTYTNVHTKTHLTKLKAAIFSFPLKGPVCFSFISTLRIQTPEKDATSMGRTGVQLPCSCPD